MQIIRDEHVSKLVANASKKLENLFSTYKKCKILFLTSGGSAFKILDKINSKYLSKNITISVLDERYSINPQINNFFQLKNLEFYIKSLKAQCNFIETIPNSKMDLEQFSKYYNEKITQWINDNPMGKIIITQGVGEDGHTAGIMPYPEDSKYFENNFIFTDNYVVGYNSGDKNIYPQRVTVTVPFLTRKVDHSVVFVAGRNKANILADIINNSKEIFQTPAEIIWKMKDVYLYTDIYD